MASNLDDLQSVQSLAHTLYSRYAKEHSSTSKVISKGIRKLRNKLEEIDDAFGESAAVRLEETQLLNAIGESSDLLHRLSQIPSDCLEGQRDPSNAALLNDLDAVTYRFSEALAGIEKMTDRIDTTLDTSAESRTRSPSTNSLATSILDSEPDVKPSSCSSAPTNSPSRMSANLCTAPSVQEELREITTRYTGRSSHYGIPYIPQQFSGIAASWATPFASPDPMSNDIDTASSIIMSREMVDLSASSGQGLYQTRRTQVTPSVTSERWFKSQSSAGMLMDLGSMDMTSTREGFNNDILHNAQTTTEASIQAQRLSVSAKQDRPEIPDEPTASLLSLDVGNEEPYLAVQQDLRGYEGERSLASDPKELNGRQINNALVAFSVRAAKSEYLEDRNGPNTGQGRESTAVSLPSNPEPKPMPGYQRITSEQLQELPRRPRDIRPKYRVVNPDTSVDQDAVWAQPEVIHSRPETPITRVPNPHDSHVTRNPAGSPEVVIAQPSEPNSFHSHARELETMRSSLYSRASTTLSTDEKDPDLFQDQSAITLPTRYLRSRRNQRSVSLIDVESAPEPLFPSPETKNTRMDSNLELDVDTERFNAIIKSWNEHLWDQAELQINGILDNQSRSTNPMVSRRLRYLLGVIASLKGELLEALRIFLCVLNTPIAEAAQLDVGDCATAYWMGDTYALLNRKPEALLAYSIAEQGPLCHGLENYSLHQCIRAEQAACQAGGTRSDWKLQMDRTMQKKDTALEGSIFNPDIISTEAAKEFLASVPWPPEKHDLGQHQGRAMWLSHSSLLWNERQRLRIDDTAFDPNGPWPITFDPFFAMANVATGRNNSAACDLLQIVKEIKIPKVGTWNRKGMSSFTCPNLQWLIITLRECLDTHEIQWSEVTDAQGVRIMARYSSVEDHIYTEHFFSIAIFRLTWRSGYGAEVCPDGISSARIIRNDSYFDKGVYRDEANRVKKMIRDYLDATLIRQEAIDFKDVAMPVMSINGVTGMPRRASTKTNRPAVNSGASSISSKTGSSLTWDIR